VGCITQWERGQVLPFAIVHDNLVQCPDLYESSLPVGCIT
jgi:hypothetical protein